MVTSPEAKTETDKEGMDFPENESGTESSGNGSGQESAQAGASANGSLGADDPRLAELEAAVKDKEARYVYLYAEFENYKKRAIRERSDLMKFGWEPVARELLQVVDNLERALAHASNPTGDANQKSLLDGLQMVLNQFKGTLEKQGVLPIETIGREFDPNLHEAVAQEDSDQPAGTVVKEASRGYTLHGRLLRPARVVVSGGRKS